MKKLDAVAGRVLRGSLNGGPRSARRRRQERAGLARGAPSKVVQLGRRRWTLRGLGDCDQDAFESLLFASRFLLAPLYMALAIGLVALIYKAGLHLYELLTQLPNMSDEEVILSDLAIVDLTLTASLVVIVFLSGYANFVAPVVMREDTEDRIGSPRSISAS